MAGAGNVRTARRLGSRVDPEPKVYSQTPMEAMTPMMTVARIGVLNLESVFPN